MKKFKSLFLVAIVAVAFAFTSCEKEDIIDQSAQISKAGYIKGTFIAKEGNLKSAPTVINRRYTYLIGQNEGGSTLLPSQLYGGVNIYAPYKLLRENLFFPDTEPNDFWADLTNNPETFGTGQIYSNLSPTVPSRMVVEVLNHENKVSHLGISDFTPSADLFPLPINDQRVGAILQVNFDDVKNIPGTPLEFVTISIDKMAPVDVLKTAISSGPTTTFIDGVPTATWPNWVYGAEESKTFNVNIGASGTVDLYNDVELNIKPEANIHIVVKIAGTTITRDVSGPAIGKGLLLNIKTDVQGWYNSQWVTPNENPLVIEEVDVDIH